MKGKHVVVTGGTGNLGRAVVARLRAAGAEVWIPVFAEHEIAGSGFEDDPGVHLVAGVNLTDEAQAEAFFARPPSLWGSVHLTGGFDMGPFVETSLAAFRKQVDLNLVTCFLSCREAARRMQRGGEGGRIVNVTAQPALQPGGYKVAYAASKAGVANLTQSVAAELAGDGIWVNAIVPSIIDTPPNRAAMPDADHEAWATPEEIAQTVVFLVSPDNAVTRGALVPVYGRTG